MLLLCYLHAEQKMKNSTPMNIRLTLFFLLAAMIISSCTHETKVQVEEFDLQLLEQLDIVSPTQNYSHYILPESSDYDNIPQEPQNPLNGPKVTLGQYLFHETGLAVNPAHVESMESFSCSSCHVASAGFRPGRFQGIADGGVGFGDHGEGRAMNEDYDETELDAQGHRPPSVLNSAYVTNTFWNGQFGSGGVNEGTEDVWDNSEATHINYQGLSGHESQHQEGMLAHRLEMNPEMAAELGYDEMFDLAFPEVPVNERYTMRTSAFAIAAYLRTLFSNQAPFQDWLKGDKTAMTTQEKEGAMLFFGKAGCYRCHNSPGLNGMEFHAFGVNDLWERGGLNTGPTDPRVLGRGGFTQKQEDMYKFKIPSIYNMKDSPFYFHGSSKESLREVVEYKNNAIPENNVVPIENLSPFFTPLHLTETEIDNLVSFLENGLRDPNLQRYVPSHLYSGNCFPNNDEQSQIDMGCE